MSNWTYEPYAERVKGFLNANLPEELKGWTFTVVNPEGRGDGTGMTIHGNFGGYAQISLTFQSYSACCAFHQLNHFGYMGTTEKLTHQLIDWCLSGLRYGITGRYAKKLVLNTVQTNPEEYSFNQIDLDADRLSGGFFYPFVHSWAKKQKSVIDTPIVNHNTSNIIHHLIVFPDVCNP